MKDGHARDLAEVQLGLGQMLMEAGQMAPAWEAFSAAARGGDARAFNMLGRMAQLGLKGEGKDYATASAMYRRAIAKGHNWALFNLADLRLEAPAPHNDAAEAVALYAQAAQAGVDKAHNMLGQCYETGRGTEADPAKAIACYKAGDAAGDCWAAFNLGRILAQAGDEAGACHFWTRALERGFAGFWGGLAREIERSGLAAAAPLAVRAHEREAKARATLARRP